MTWMAVLPCDDAHIPGSAHKGFKSKVKYHGYGDTKELALKDAHSEAKRNKGIPIGEPEYEEIT